MPKEFYNPYEKYGLRRVLNAATSMTNLGGSISRPEVFRAMEDASKSFVHIPELQAWAGRHIAEATGAEAGLPVAGASAGLLLAAAACMMRGTELERFDPLGRGQGSWAHLTTKLPMHTEGLKTEFIVHRSGRNSYDHAIECAGGHFKEVGTAQGATESELLSAYDPEKTAAYYYTAREARNGLPLSKVLEIAHVNDVPVIVDAAAELPPKRKLKYYAQLGAHLVSYSGGKHLAGPNNSGLLAGKKELIKLAHLQSYPFSGVGRVAKMSRETIVGLVAALKLYLEHDEEALYQNWLRVAGWIAEQLQGLRGVKAGVTYQRAVEDGEPMAPFCYLELDETVTRIGGRELVERLRDGDPSIAAMYEPAFLIEDYRRRVILNPEYMLEGEEEILIQEVKKLLR